MILQLIRRHSIFANPVVTFSPGAVDLPADPLRFLFDLSVGDCDLQLAWRIKFVA